MSDKWTPLHALVVLAEEVQALFTQGHEQAYSVEDADVVWGPTAHRMSLHERPWLDDAIEEARRLKYPSKALKNAT